MYYKNEPVDNYDYEDQPHEIAAREAEETLYKEYHEETIKSTVDWLRDAAPYIYLFRNKIFIVSISKRNFPPLTLSNLIQDLSFLCCIGVKIIIVFDPKDKNISESQWVDRVKKGPLKIETRGQIRTRGEYWQKCFGYTR